MDHKLTFWCVLYYLSAFGTVWLPYGTRCKTGRTGGKVRAKKSRHNFSEHTGLTPLGPKLMFWCVSYYLGAFGTVFCPTTQCKTGQLVQKFVPQSRVGIFPTIAPDPPHWTLNRHSVAFHTIWVLSGSFGCRTKLGAQRAELVQSSWHEVASEFFTMNAPDSPHWTLN